MAENRGQYAIECSGLTRRFGTFTAVDDLTLGVKPGELFGFLGPNGAGKTTAINILTTLLTPSAGNAVVAGFDLVENAPLVRAKIGVVPQQFALFEELTPLENLWYIGELYGMDGGEARKRSDELLKIVALYEKRGIKASTFSGGMKQSLSIAASLVHSPQILFMDEPTSGLDPQSRIALRELTSTLNQTGMTIIYTTHDMEEAEKLCQRIAIMDHGKLIALGTPNELKSMDGHGFKISLELSRADAALAEGLKKLARAQSASCRGHTVELRVKEPRLGLVQEIAAYLSKARVELKNFTSNEATLEEVFISLTKKELRN